MINLLFDTETTGLPFHDEAKDAVQPHIIEWGGVLANKRGVVIDELNLLINPGMKLPEKITKITGLTDEDLVEAPSFAEVADQIMSFFARASAMIAHNLPFDAYLITLEVQRAGLLWPWPKYATCTVQEHAEEWGYRPKLTELYKYYFDTPLAQSHRALDDVKALLKIAVAAGVLK